MSTLKATNLQHPSAASPNVVMGSTGSVAVAGALTGAGMDLVTPSSIAYSGGSASVSGGGVSFSGSTSVSLNGVFSSLYQNYAIVICSKGTVGGLASTLLRFRAAGSDTTTNYSYLAMYNTHTGGPNRSAGAATTSGFIGAVGDWDNQIVVNVAKPNISGTNIAYSGTYISPGSTASEAGNYGGWLTATAVYDGITVFVNSGTFTGTIRVYGYRNS